MRGTSLTAAGPDDSFTVRCSDRAWTVLTENHLLHNSWTKPRGLDSRNDPQLPEPNQRRARRRRLDDTAEQPARCWRDHQQRSYELLRTGADRWPRRATRREQDLR